MNTKSLAILAVLAAAGVGLYIKIHSVPPPVDPDEAAGTYDTTPQVDLGAASTSFGSFPATNMGNRSSGTEADAAPPYQPDSRNAPGYAPPADAGLRPDGSIPSTSGLQSPVSRSGRTDYAPSASPFDNRRSDDFLAPGKAPSSDPRGVGPLGEPPTANITADPQRLQEQFNASWEQAQTMLAQNRLDGALQLLSPWYGEPALSSGIRRELQELLNQLAGTVLYSPEVHVEPAYVVQPGERLADIAAHCRVSPQLLMNVNGLASETLIAGQSIKVLRGPFSAEIDWRQREMALFLEGRYAGRFLLGIGRDCPELAGDYVVTELRVQPVYPDATAGGTAGQAVNEYWIGLGRPQAGKAASEVYLHSATDAGELDRAGAPGYLRLSARDAPDAYTILSVGSTVAVRR